MTEQSKEAVRYATLCNLQVHDSFLVECPTALVPEVETLWLTPPSKSIDFKDLEPLTSPQARRVASFIHSLYEDDLLELKFAEEKLDDIKVIARY